LVLARGPHLTAIKVKSGGRRDSLPVLAAFDRAHASDLGWRNLLNGDYATPSTPHPLRMGTNDVGYFHAVRRTRTTACTAGSTRFAWGRLCAGSVGG